MRTGFNGWLIGAISGILLHIHMFISLTIYTATATLPLRAKI